MATLRWIRRLWLRWRYGVIKTDIRTLKPGDAFYVANGKGDVFTIEDINRKTGMITVSRGAKHR